MTVDAPGRSAKGLDERAPAAELETIKGTPHQVLLTPHDFLELDVTAGSGSVTNEVADEPGAATAITVKTTSGNAVLRYG